jgi:hypothetical protein
MAAKKSTAKKKEEASKKKASSAGLMKYQKDIKSALKVGDKTIKKAHGTSLSKKKSVKKKSNKSR